MGKKEDKTNVMRIFDQKKITYRHYQFDATPETTGVQIADILKQDPARCFKTLVTVAKSGEHYVFMIPVARTLDLKKAARAIQEKSIDMLPLKELFPLTGYVHGGCSPVGMKKTFVTTIDSTAQNFDTLFFSGGRIGVFVDTALSELAKVTRFQFADITVEE